MYLHEYQKRACNFLAVHPSAILAVDMGLGKTATVLHFLDWMRMVGKSVPDTYHRSEESRRDGVEARGGAVGSLHR